MYIKQYTNDALSLGFRIVRMTNIYFLSLGFKIVRMSTNNSLYFNIQIFKAFNLFVITSFILHIMLWIHKNIHVRMRCSLQGRMIRDGALKCILHRRKRIKYSMTTIVGEIVNIWPLRLQKHQTWLHKYNGNPNSIDCDTR